MRYNLKRIMSFLLAFVLLVGLLPMQVFASSWHTTPWEERTDNVYSSNWKNWSQGASQYYCMAKYGCHIVSQSKMLREAGIVGGTFNPDVFHRWMLNNKGYDGRAESLNEHSPCNEQVIRYIKANDSTASLRKVYLNDSNLSAQDRISMLQKYVNQDCYIVLGLGKNGTAHQDYVLQAESKKKGRPVVSCTRSDGNTAPILYYQGVEGGTAQTISGGFKKSGKNVWYKHAYVCAFVYTIDKKNVNVVSKVKFKTTNNENSVTVSLSNATSGSTIYYTTNGKTPTTDSTKYTGSFQVSKTTVVKAIAVKSGSLESDIATKKITVNACPAPTIKCELAADGYQITITGKKGEKFYYTTDGTTPTNKSTRYQGPFVLDHSGTIKAIANKDGMRPSAVSSKECVVQIPGVPAPRRTASCPDKVGLGDNISVVWDKVPLASSYHYTVSRNGAPYIDSYTNDTLLSLPAEQTGEYSVTVRAVNLLGESAESISPVVVTVMPNVTVTFLDWDDTALSEQSIKYNADAVAPSAPSRIGHTFSRWEGVYHAVKQDVTIRAVYAPNTYTIRFEDTDGSLLSTELVEYGGSVKTVPVPKEKTGYTFVAWSVKSGEGSSYTEVDGNAVFAPIFAWANPDLPVALQIVKALRSADAKSYQLTVKTVNPGDQDVLAKLVTAIKTSNDKIVATRIQTIEIPAHAEDQTVNITIAATNVGVKAEAYVIANDAEHDNRTGGAYSDRAVAEVTQESTETITYWSEWSDWSTSAPPEDADVEEKTQYSYRDQQTTTSTNASLSGWTQTGSNVSYSDWGSWSSWALTKQTASNTRDVGTRTVYHYQHYCDGSGNIAPSTSYSNGKYGPHSLYFTSKQKVSRSSSTGYTITDGLTKCAKGAGSYYYMGTATQYRYRTRTATTYYTYTRWGEWSDWSDSPVAAGSTRDVRSRTVYRYRTLQTRENTSSEPYLGEEDLSGKEYTVSGKLDKLDEDYSGKLAVVMVYKDRNTDPTEDQMEYIGQLTLGSENSYEFSFIPREPISAETGNYIVSFGIATADGLVNNAEIIEAPKPTHLVVFKDVAGEVLSTQTVPFGEDAVPPEFVETEGYRMSWNRSFSCITGDTVITAVAEPKDCVVVFIDWANSVVVSMEEFKYGQPLTFPENRAAEGKIFRGWSSPEGSLVNGNMVVEALYDDIMVEATFLNHDGSVYCTQRIPYGSSVTLPEENPTDEGYQFIAWSVENKWWNVTEDITIEPIFIYAQTAETPMIEAEMEEIAGPQEVILETSTEEGEIHYTTDGSLPTEESPIYFENEPIYLMESTLIRAVTICNGMNASDVAEISIEFPPESDDPLISYITDVSQYNISENTANLVMKLENPEEDSILEYGYALVNLTSGETEEYSNSLDPYLTDRVLGRVFTIRGLQSGTEYEYWFYAELENHGFISSESACFITEGDAPAPSKDELEEAITSAEAVDKEKYTEESVAALEEALEAAQAVLAKEDAAQDEIDAAAQAVNDAIAGLKEKTVEPPVADKTELEEAITAAKAVDKEKYTEESVAALEEALEAAHVVLAKEDATQEEIDAAAQAVTDAIAGLKEKTVVPTFLFDDVKNEKAFYYQSVYWAYNYNPQITNGIDKTHFGPDRGCTRGQVVTFLWRAAGCPAPASTENPFIDVKDGAFYYKAVLWAVEKGITNGMSATTFAPDATCTRGQIVTFLWRYAGQPAVIGDKHPFTDVNAGSYYEKAVIWAAEAGVTAGTSATAFSPNSTCTRGQVVTFLYRQNADAERLEVFDTDSYEIVLDNCTWEEARAAAEAKGGKLVTLDSMDEYRFILRLIAAEGDPQCFYYLGARRDLDGETYHWIDKANQLTGGALNAKPAWCVAQWQNGEPNLVWKDRQETVVVMFYSSSERRWCWYDGPADGTTSGRQYGYIIEY